jgi:peptidoglycan-N-acetylglucosamine deacetylase
MKKLEVLRRFIAASAVMIAAGGAIAFVVGSALAGWAGWAFFGLVCLLVLLWAYASFTPNSPLFGRVVTGRGTNDRVLALTFDDGPSADWTPPVLDALREQNARATFFVLGRNAEAHPELIRRISDEGHEIASHGYDHALLTFASQADVDRQLERTERSLADALGEEPKARLFRAPHGFRNPFVARATSRRGYEVVGWTKGVWDTAKPGVETIVRRTIGGFRPGGILLLHDADGSGLNDERSQTAEAVPEIVERAHAAGYELVTVSELAIRAPAKRTATWRIIAGLVLFAVLLELALRTVDISTVNAVDIVWWWVGVALLLNLVSIVLKAAVWKAALDTIPDHPKFLYAHVIPALFVGFLLNTLLPARLGEIGRVSVLRRRLRMTGIEVPNATLAGSVVAEQIVLAIALVAIMVLQLPFVNIPARFEHMILAFGGVIIVVLLAVIGLETFSHRGGNRRSRADLALARGHQAAAMLYGILRGLHQGQTVLRRPRTALFALLAGLASWAAQIGGIYAALAAADIHPTIGRAGLVFLVSTLVQLFPFWPGNVGLFQGAVAQVLVQAYPIDFPHAIAFAVGLQVIEVSLGVGLGFWFLSREGLSLSEVRGLRTDD